MEEKEIVDQSVLAEDVSSKIKYEFVDAFLVKPLDPIKVKKEFSKPVAKSEPTKDKNGVVAQDFDEVETEVKEVNSDYLTGIILKVPVSYIKMKNDNEHNFMLCDYNVGDTVVFRSTGGLQFDLLKDSRLLKIYDIIAKAV